MNIIKDEKNAPKAIYWSDQNTKNNDLNSQLIEFLRQTELDDKSQFFFKAQFIGNNNFPITSNQEIGYDYWYFKYQKYLTIFLIGKNGTIFDSITRSDISGMEKAYVTAYKESKNVVVDHSNKVSRFYYF